MGEHHWRLLTEAMERPELAEDPRFATVAQRIGRMEEVDAIISAWTRTFDKYALFDLLSRHRVPCAPVRDLGEVIVDRHMHERGMLQWMDHPEFGRIVVPNSPLRFEGTAPMALAPSPLLGQHNEDVYCGWLGRPPGDLDALRAEGVI